MYTEEVIHSLNISKQRKERFKTVKNFVTYKFIQWSSY